MEHRDEDARVSYAPFFMKNTIYLQYEVQGVMLISR